VRLVKGRVGGADGHGVVLPLRDGPAPDHPPLAELPWRRAE
jgi:hypothetical protein